MTKHTYFLTIAPVFTTVCTFHIIRAFMGWEILIHGWSFPIWGSWAIFLLTGTFAYYAWKFGVN